jgi:hypothetical protein
MECWLKLLCSTPCSTAIRPGMLKPGCSAMQPGAPAVCMNCLSCENAAHTASARTVHFEMARAASALRVSSLPEKTVLRACGSCATVRRQQFAGAVSSTLCKIVTFSFPPAMQRQDRPRRNPDLPALPQGLRAAPATPVPFGRRVACRRRRSWRRTQR